MTVRIFGWSYPPGCSGLPDDETPCPICGLFGDKCICPECPICFSFGDPHCYEHHGLVRSQEQIESLKKQEEEWDRSNEYDYPYSDEGE